MLETKNENTTEILLEAMAELLACADKRHKVSTELLICFQECHKLLDQILSELKLKPKEAIK